MFGLSGTEIAFLLVVILLAGATGKLVWLLVRLFRSFWRRWARKDLSPGDVSALLGLSRAGLRPIPARLQRLRRRGFIDEDDTDLR